MHAGGDLPAKETGRDVTLHIVSVQPHLIKQHFMQLGAFVDIQFTHCRAFMGADCLLAAVKHASDGTGRHTGAHQPQYFFFTAAQGGDAALPAFPNTAGVQCHPRLLAKTFQ